MVLLLWLSNAIGFGPTPINYTAPGTVFDFMHKWELQTCFQSPTVVVGPMLQKYKSKHFYLDQGPSIVFLTPDNSTARTTHSTHPRTEMRDISVPDWPWPRTSALEEGAGGIRHILTATLVVDHVAATKPETVIAQIHGSIDEEIAKIVKLRWTGGLVEARVILLLLFHSSTFSPHSAYHLRCWRILLTVQTALQYMLMYKIPDDAMQQRSRTTPLHLLNLDCTFFLHLVKSLVLIITTFHKC